MDIRFVAHAPYIDNRENLSCIELLHALNWAVPRRLDSLERIDDVPDTLGELKELLGVVNESDFATIVPVGDLGFVSRWLTLMPNAADPSMTPIEIPPALRKFAGRRWRLSLGDELLGDDFDSHKTFLKDADTLKKWNSLLCGGDMSGLVDRDTTYAVSEKVDFLSEWRTFVNDGRIVGIENYLGDPTLFPEREILFDMVRKMQAAGEAPGAYTLDVGVMAAGSTSHLRSTQISDGHATVPIEVHPFVACGLYGFSDPRELPDMIISGYNWYYKDAPRDLREKRMR